MEHYSLFTWLGLPWGYWVYVSVFIGMFLIVPILVMLVENDHARFRPFILCVTFISLLLTWGWFDFSPWCRHEGPPSIVEPIIIGGIWFLISGMTTFGTVVDELTYQEKQKTKRNKEKQRSNEQKTEIFNSILGRK